MLFTGEHDRYRRCVLVKPHSTVSLIPESSTLKLAAPLMMQLQFNLMVAPGSKIDCACTAASWILGTQTSFGLVSVREFVHSLGSCSTAHTLLEVVLGAWT